MATLTLQKSSKELYEEGIKAICEQHGITNRFAAPKIEKVCLNMGVGRAIQDGQILNVVSEHLTLLAGQRATITKAKKSIANFKSRADMKIGARVTLRGERMWSFLDKLINIAIPRIRDFRGISAKAFDKQGNYNLGLREQALFLEITLDKLEHNQGLNITICFRNSTPDMSRDVLKQLNFPFREQQAAK